MEKVIIYGIGTRMLNRIEWFSKHFEIVGYSDSNVIKAENLRDQKDMYIAPGELAAKEYDRIVIASTFVKEITEYLTKELALPADKLVTDYDVYWEKLLENKKSFGERNPDTTFLVIGFHAPTYGVYGYYQLIIEYMKEALYRGLVPVVDMQNFQNAYLSEDKFGKENSWEYFYQNPLQVSLGEVYQSKNVICTFADSPHPIMKPRDGITKILDDHEVRAEYHKIALQYLKMNDKSCQAVEEAEKRLLGPVVEKGNKICGVLYRGTDYKNLKPFLHNIQPTLEELIEKTKECMQEWGYEYLYLSTEDQEAVDTFREVFGEKMICLDRVRFTDTGNKLLAEIGFERENDKYIKGINYITEITLLSRCNAIIAGKVGGTLGALIMNEGYEHEYFFQLGVYGLH